MVVQYRSSTKIIKEYQYHILLIMINNFLFNFYICSSTILIIFNHIDIKIVLRQDNIYIYINIIVIIIHY